MQTFRHVVLLVMMLGFFFSYSEGLQNNPLLLSMQYKTTILSTYILQTVSWTSAFFCMNCINDLLCL